MNIVFMGTPEFSTNCLQALIESKHNVLAVFTQTDKPFGRHQVMTPSPIKKLAEENEIPVFQPKTLKDGSAFSALNNLNPDLIVVVAYGKILPAEIIDLPKHGCINIHASLLPNFRGAAPIQWAVMNGEDKTGITSMQMDTGIDTGDMLLKKEIAIDENETAGQLHDKLAPLGAKVLIETLEALEKGELKPEKQKEEGSSYASMLSKEMGKIDWSLPARDIHNKIRGLNPWPLAETSVCGKSLKITASAVCDIKGMPGEIVNVNGKLVIACKDGSVEILTLKPVGKREMTTQEFLAGNRLKTGIIVE